MADNTTLASGSGGDTVRTLDRLTKGVKTETMQIDAAGGDPNAESLVSGQNPLPVYCAYVRVEACIEMLQARLVIAQPQNGFSPCELSDFLGVL